MAKSIVLAADPSRLASLLLSYIPAVCAFVAPSQPGVSVAIIDRLSHSRAPKGMRMNTTWLAAAVVSAGTLCGCDHPAAPAAPVTAETPERTLTDPVPVASDSAPAPSTAPPKGKRVPCTTDQSCNRDPSTNALWGHCVKESGVCECNPGYELHPGGYCQPIAK